jgi:signal transduction histidine kinase
VGTFRTRDRIVVPFVLIAVVATVAAALVSLSLISNTLEARVESQIARGSAFVSRSQFALSPSVLRLVKEIMDADVVTFGPGMAPVVTTVDATLRPGLVGAVIANAPPEVGSVGPDGYQLRAMTVDGAPHLVAYRPITERPGAVMAFVAETSELAQALRSARLRVLIVAGVSLCLFFVVSEIVARRVSGPIERLLAATRAAGTGSPVRGPAGGEDEVARLAQVFNDMDDRLRSSQDALVRSEKLAVTGLLAARVAHDVRNPLSSIKMQTQLLRSRLKHDADNQALLRAVLNDIDQVESVVRGLLELARPGELKLRETPLAGLVDDLLQQVSAQMAHRNIVVAAKLDPGLPAVRLDVERFRQALVNLIANAADAMTDGGTLTLVAARSDDRSSVLLDVCDDGTGIDPAVADRLFDPFMSTKRDGIGLGLVNTKAIVESHGGSIELSPRASGGTRARITLPVPSA